MSTDTDDSLLEFPCDFPIKAMGRASAEFEAAVLEIVRRHVSALADDAVRKRPSRNGNYLSITVVVRADDKQQLNAIYADLSAHQEVLMAL